jgi:hypothetical protein
MPDLPTTTTRSTMTTQAITTPPATPAPARPMGERNQGRKPLKAGVESVVFAARMTPDMREKLVRLGGQEWLRKQIQKAKG